MVSTFIDIVIYFVTYSAPNNLCYVVLLVFYEMIFDLFQAVKYRDISH